MNFIKLETGGYIVAEQMGYFGIEEKGDKFVVVAYTTTEQRCTIKTLETKPLAIGYLDKIISDIEKCRPTIVSKKKRKKDDCFFLANHGLF